MAAGFLVIALGVADASAMPVLPDRVADVAAASVRPTKVLTIIEENHSLSQMRQQMPYLFSLAKRYAYADHYFAVSHPSLPNYLAIAGGSTFAITDDNNPSAHRIAGRSVFDQAINHHKTARTYAEGMPQNCALLSSGGYAVRHNPWAYFARSRSSCRQFAVPAGQARGRLHHASTHNALPNIGLAIPSLCHDAHDCSLATADAWLAGRLPAVLKSRDFASGRLVVVVTADEDDRHSGNRVLTVVLAAGLSHKVVSRPLSHYSLLGYFDHVLGAPLLRHAAPGFAKAFGL